MHSPVKLRISSPLETLFILIALAPSVIFGATGGGSSKDGNNGQNQSSNAFNGTNLFVRSSPPIKSLFSSQLFHPNNLGLLKTLTPYPLRESYIAFEQAHPIGGTSPGIVPNGFDQYFKPSKFPPPGYDTSEEYYTTRLQNNYPPPASPPHYLNQHQHQHHQPLYLPLPPPPPPPPFLRLVKIPGDLKVSVSTRPEDGRNDLEIVCEFPGYVLIVQQIYWHVIPPPTSLLLPYGTFYDSRNGFGPRVTVTRVSKWKSILRVRDFTPDDFGMYRCVSTAILPDDPEPTYRFPYRPTRQPPPPPPPTSYLLHFPPESFSELRSSASTIPSPGPGYPEAEELEKEEERKPSSKRERKIKFRRNKREIGAFGVYAPFFKPHYGIYRVFMEVQFYGDPFGAGAGSDIVENTVSGPSNEGEQSGSGSGNMNSTGAGKTNPDNSIENDVKQTRNGRRKFDFAYGRKSKVLFK